MSTKIEWCRNEDGSPGETINPLGWGCYGPEGTPESPKICSYCYAKRMAHRGVRGCDLCRQFIPHWHTEQLEKIRHWRKPRRIFIQSMGDLFGDWVPDGQIEQVKVEAIHNPHHTFQFLTKNPKRLKDFNPWPANCWVGTTVTNQADMNKRLEWLMQVDASVRFISHEPLLGKIDVATPYNRAAQILSNRFIHYGRPNWVIIGSMTGPGAVRAEDEWVDGLISQYQAALVPIFLKDNLYPPGTPATAKFQEFPCA